MAVNRRMALQIRRNREIEKLETATVQLLVDAIERVMDTHSEPYRTLAEALILSRGPGAAKLMAQAIHEAVDADCGFDAGRGRQ